MPELPPLHYAVVDNDQDKVNKLIKESSRDEINTALHLAIMNNNLDLYDVLIENNANINSKDVDGNTPLHLAILYNYQDIIKMDWYHICTFRCYVVRHVDSLVLKLHGSNFNKAASYDNINSNKPIYRMIMVILVQDFLNN